MWTRAAFFLLTTLALFFATGLSSEAGGAWPRGKDKFFASLSYSTFGDVQRYITGPSYQIPGVEPVELTEEFGLFFEVGLTDTFSAGVDRSSRPNEKMLNSVQFLRWSYARPNWKSSYGIEIGFGGYRDWRQINDTQLRLGLSWGRGFQTPWFGGWAEVDAKLAGTKKTETTYWKIDSTFGIKPTERGLFYLQMQSGAIDDYAFYARAQPTYVMKINERLSLESAVLLGLQNDDAQGMKLGAWLEF